MTNVCQTPAWGEHTIPYGQALLQLHTSQPHSAWDLRHSTRIVTWNVSTLNRTGRQVTVVSWPVSWRRPQLCRSGSGRMENVGPTLRPPRPCADDDDYESDLINPHTIRYDTVDLRALKSWRHGQLNLAHGPETINNEKIKIKIRVVQKKRCRQKSVETVREDIIIIIIIYSLK